MSNVPEAEIINGSVYKGVSSLYQTSLHRRVATARKVSLAPVEEQRMRHDGGKWPQNRSTLINFFSLVVQTFAWIAAWPAVTLATRMRACNCSRASQIASRYLMSRVGQINFENIFGTMKIQRNIRWNQYGRNDVIRDSIEIKQ